MLAVPSVASAADTKLTIRGAGWGHGVGMSQYGALGFAQKGASYRQILGHYYSGTQIGSAAGRTVRVLIASPTGVQRFSNATRAGTRRLSSRRSYGVRARGANVDLLSSTGRRIATFTAPLSITSSAPISLAGRGAYRGAFEFRPAGRGLNAVNAVGIDDYVAGVISRESPSSWPLEALKAQAVAARTYALTTSKGGAGFEHYADTRSQVYGGVAAETPSTNRAASETRGEVVTYQGRPVVTYFFSTSGGKTENVEHSLGGAPQPHLKSVDDPYDSVSPKHRWTVRLTVKQAAAKLRGLVKGSFRGIQVVQRGVSPRIVAADVVGSRGRTRVTGAQLRARLGLNDTWASFTTISTGEEEPPADEPAGGDGGGKAGAGGGAAPARRASGSIRAATRFLSGRVIRTKRGGKATVEIRTRRGWESAGTARIRRDGTYRFGLCAKGTYRVRVGQATGPAVRVRL